MPKNPEIEMPGGASDAAGAYHPQKTFLGHPRGLFVLFFTEMWERFSYYGMRALLVLYMVNYFKWTQQDASLIYKWYTSLVYLTPLIGGYLADRYLGNKRAIIIGASLMAIGHFCMAFEQIEIFYAALIFLIAGNGMFKPNMATQVGRLYPANDPRRDSAYTIFYMGINLGAFLSPILCGWLRVNTKWGFHAGFAAAGVGMVCGLLIYLLWQPAVQEIPRGVVYTGEDLPKKQKHQDHYVSEAQAATVPSVLPFLSRIAPILLAVLAVVWVAATVILAVRGTIAVNNAVAFGLGGGFACGAGAWITSHLHLAMRDRVLAIYVVAVFVVFFWMAFEQAGNAMNVFADKTSQRYLTQPAPPPSIYPAVDVEESRGSSQAEGSLVLRAVNPFSAGWFSSVRPWVMVIAIIAMVLLWRLLSRPSSYLSTPWRLFWVCFVTLLAFGVLCWSPTRADFSRMFNPVTTEWFQSINALAIFVIAPIFAWMWVYLPRHGINLSIPAKISIGVFLQGLAFVLMWWSISFENGPSSTRLATLPPGVTIDEKQLVVFRDAPDLDADAEEFDSFDQPVDSRGQTEGVNGGRIVFNKAESRLDMNGVLADTDRDRLLRASVPKSYLLASRDLARASTEAKKKGAGSFSVEIPLTEIPKGYDLRFSGFKPEEVRLDESSRKLISTVELSDREYKNLLVAGADVEFRNALNELFVASAKFKVSSAWLFWFYILCTLGELCLSPVGLSMVSKLAPAAYATMLMGVWHLTSFFGNFLAGLFGEYYGKYDPADYFMVIAAALGAASLICFALVKLTRRMMHGVM